MQTRLILDSGQKPFPKTPRGLDRLGAGRFGGGARDGPGGRGSRLGHWGRSARRGTAGKQIPALRRFFGCPRGPLESSRFDLFQDALQAGKCGQLDELHEGHFQVQARIGVPPHLSLATGENVEEPDQVGSRKSLRLPRHHLLLAVGELEQSFFPTADLKDHEVPDVGQHPARQIPRIDPGLDGILHPLQQGLGVPFLNAVDDSGYEFLVHHSQ